VETHELIEKKFLHNAYCRYGEIYFAVSDQLFSIDEVLADYKFSDIRSTDIVLDIGANIGAFTLLAARKAKHVYAVEPIYTNILRKNIEKNNIKNVTVIERGIGFGTHTIKYGNKSKTLSLTTLTDLLKGCGNVDFLKCDCEGCEHTFTVNNLKGIRRIEIEVHKIEDLPVFRSFQDSLAKADFNYEVEPRRNGTIIIHAEAK